MAKKDYRRRFLSLKDHMKEVYERKYDEAKNYLLQVFQAEYAKLHAIFLKNKFNFE